MQNLDALKQLLAWLVVGGGASYVAYWLVDHIPQLARLEDDLKRYAAIGMAALHGAAASGVQVAAHIAPAPPGFWGWLNAVVAVVGLVFGGSQVAHAARELRAKRLA